MKVLIAGGNGFLGKFLVTELIGLSHEVTVLDQFITQPTTQKSKCKYFEYDVTKQNNIELCEKYDVAIFLAQSPLYRQLPEKAPEVFLVNVTGLVNFIELSRNCGVKQFIYASSGSIYPPSFTKLKENTLVQPQNLYGLTKKIGEDIFCHYKDYFMNLSLRFFFLYGPGQKNMLIPNLITNIRSGETLFLEKAEHENEETGGLIITPTYVEDAAKLISEMIVKKCEGIYNIAGSEVMSIRQIASLIGESLKTIPLFKISEKIRKGDFIADNSKMLSIYPQKLTSFKDGINKTIESLK